MCLQCVVLVSLQISSSIVGIYMEIACGNCVKNLFCFDFVIWNDALNYACVYVRESV